MRYIDLFCGIGGFRAALQAAGDQCVLSCDKDRLARLTYQLNWGDHPYPDVTRLRPEDVPEHNVICAGFPCPSFSVAGKRGGLFDPRGRLFLSIVRIAKHHRPEALLLENVPGILSHERGLTLEIILAEFRAIGYEINQVVLNAGDYGAATARKRVYFACFRKDLRARFETPRPVPDSPVLRDVLLPERVTGRFVVRRHDLHIERLPTEPQRRPIYIGHLGPKAKQLTRVYSDMGQAITLTTRHTGLYLVGDQVRRLAPRECARVMGFPDRFRIPVSDTEAWKQLGNSVAVPAVRAVWRQMKAALARAGASLADTADRQLRSPGGNEALASRGEM